MLKNYFKRSVMLLGAVAVIATASADGGYRDVTLKYMKNPAFFPGWQGAITAIADGVGETYNGAFNLYQTIPAEQAPAGKYTLTCNAFYRCGTNDFSKDNMADGKNHNAYVYINDEKVAVIGLFDNGKVRPGENEEFNGSIHAPNNTWEANLAFVDGQYVNTVEFTADGVNDLVVGIMNEGGYNDEWCCFSNFKLVGPEGDIALANANFSEGFSLTKDAEKDGWDMVNSGGDIKTPDVNKGGGVYRKTNASPYNFGQKVTLPAGKYRFSALTFLRHGGAGDYSGKIITCKGEWKLNDVDNSPLDWYEKDLYANSAVKDNAYLYMAVREAKPTKMTMGGFGSMLNPNTDKLLSLLDCWQICEGDYSIMPENETRGTAAGTEIVPAYEETNALQTMIAGWNDSGVERESAYVFINESEKYRQYIEFELTAETSLWIGIAKDENAPSQYWNPFADFKLEYFDTNYGGVDNVIADEAIDENAPVEYYNLQGVRVADPANGLYIVKQGNKISKQIIRK